MKKIRVWAFPAGLLLAWVIASVYTLSALMDASAQHHRMRSPAAASTPHT
jgi:hypothetical protein